MKSLMNSPLIEVIILAILSVGLIGYIATEFFLSYQDATLAPFKTGSMPMLIIALIGGCLAWCIDGLINKIRILMGNDQGNAKRENMVVRYLGRFIEKYL